MVSNLSLNTDRKKNIFLIVYYSLILTPRLYIELFFLFWIWDGFERTSKMILMSGSTI